ncbi:MAG: topoisomerase DNA-binding C4 zinc finger domain-containing protein [Selenomonadaceae bacterium]|nr:topoisomerase DNA-binding C4 zinc finger domain-containing protein [Selenomonadaceae bacterium]
MAEKILKSVILVESTAKARTLRKYVGRSYSVMSTDGFLKDLPKSRIGVSDDYQPEYITVRGRGKLLAELKRETLTARRIFFATNPDARGEFLARQYCELFGVNPKSHCRIWLEELTKKNFKAAFEDMRTIDENLADSFQAKQLLDKYVSHKVGEYLSMKIWRGVKVGRFRAMLLKLIAEPPQQKVLTVGKILTPTALQELAFKELDFSTARTRVLADQLYEGINFNSDGYAGLITYPHDRGISLTSENREPAAVQEYLTENQFKLYELIHAHLAEEKTFELDDTANDATLMAALDALKVDWSDFYSAGIASLIKRKYITAEDSIYKVTALGEKVLDALNGFFDEVFSVDSYNEVTAQVKEVAAGKAEKISVIKNYCAKFNEKFAEAINSLGEDAAPQNEPIEETEEICEKCGRKMWIRHGRYGAFLACSGYPECKNTKPILEFLDKKCPKCGGRLARRSLNRGRTFYCCENSPQCDFATWDEPQIMTCKICGSTMFAHKFKDRIPMFYCGNENCQTRSNHPVNKILEDVRKRAEVRKARKEKAAFRAAEKAKAPVNKSARRKGVRE